MSGQEKKTAREEPEEEKQNEALVFTYELPPRSLPISSCWLLHLQIPILTQYELMGNQKFITRPPAACDFLQGQKVVRSGRHEGSNSPINYQICRYSRMHGILAENDINRGISHFGLEAEGRTDF